MKLFLIALFVTLTFTMQENYDYELTPIGQYKLAESEIENGYVHIFSVLRNQKNKPRYLIYLVKSSLTQSVTNDELSATDNINAVLAELGASLKSEVKNKRYDNVEGVSFEVGMNEENKALVFLTSNGRDVYKLVFIAPSKTYDTYINEYTQCLNSFKILN